MNRKLEGKIALITGSGRGIGKALALKLSSEGAKVVINDLDEVPANETVAEIKAKGGEAIAVVGMNTNTTPRYGTDTTAIKIIIN